MKLTVQLKLLPNAEQAASLLETMKAFNAAASHAAKVGFDAGVYSRPSIQKLCYYELRTRFGLSAQMAVRAISKASEAFASSGRDACPIFRDDGAMTYDERILSFKDVHKVSILTLAGRAMMPFVLGEYQATNLKRIRGQCDLVRRDGMFFLYCAADFPEEPAIEVKAFLGIDLGIVNIATDSTGETFSGDSIDRNRKRRATARKQHQRKGTKNAKRKLKRMSGRQARFQKATNHTVSKRLVTKAKALGVGIAMEDLQGIRNRVEPTVGKRFRRRFGNWSFSHLRYCVEYKARLAGVPVVLVDPRNTSRTCSACGHCEKANRPSQAVFKCKQCGHSENADSNAAKNISSLGASSKLPSKAATAQVSGKAAI